MLCHADADLITYNWRDTQPHPYPDFSINRKCKDINDLITFRDERKVDMRKYEKMKKPKATKPIPMELGYYPMVSYHPQRLFKNTLLTSSSQFGFDGSELYPNGEGAPPLPEINYFGRPGHETQWM